MCRAPLGPDASNYARIAVGVVLVFSASYWIFRARKWFTGLRTHSDEARLAAVEAEFEHIERELGEVD
ncbi:MAG TPA: hypothetical protein VMD28_10235 [Acidimicrobiales bacterium]|nr:hypothetical protein [Acidimicrobiales bacterium]